MDISCYTDSCPEDCGKGSCSSCFGQIACEGAGCQWNQDGPAMWCTEPFGGGGDDICELPADSGNCLAYFERFAFNPLTGECEEFVWGGCGGNDNNFETLEECQKACGGSTTYDPCAGKKCGDMCTMCPPGDTDCMETMEIKACNSDGQCVSDTGNLCEASGACSGSQLPGSGFMNSFDSFGGCGDITLYALKTDGTMELVLNISTNLCGQAHTAGQMLEKDYDLTGSEASLKIRVGTNVSDATCDDALEPPPNEMKVDEEFKAISGTVTVKVTPEGQPQPWSSPAKVTATLNNIKFEDGDGCSTVISSFTWADVTVGWFPG